MITIALTLISAVVILAFFAAFIFAFFCSLMTDDYGWAQILSWTVIVAVAYVWIQSK